MLNLADAGGLKGLFSNTDADEITGLEMTGAGATVGVETTEEGIEALIYGLGITFCGVGWGVGCSSNCCCPISNFPNNFFRSIYLVRSSSNFLSTSACRDMNSVMSF